MGESNKPQIIKRKIDCYELYEAGFFGNRARIWTSYEELLASSWDGEVSVRGKKQINRGKVEYNVQVSRVPEILRAWTAEGIPLEGITFNESMPDDRLTIQGEVMRWPGGLYILYSDVKKPMNVALKENSMHALGLNALLLLQKNLWPSSLSDLEVLFELFPDSVVEFSSYEILVGNLPDRNTVIWEVRNY